MSSLREKYVTRISQLQDERIDWLCPQRVAAGSLVIMDGDPGLGKSLLTLDLAARLSTGRPWPGGASLSDQDGATPPCSVVLLSAEDDYENTIKPRLGAAGADCDRIHRFQVGIDGVTGLPAFPEDLDLLAETIREQAARLVVFDPLLAFLSPGVGGQQHLLLRRVLGPLGALARDHGAAIVLIRHLTKGGRGHRALYRGLGGMAIIGTARTAFLAGPDPDHPDLALLACTKSNLSAMPPTLAYRINQSAAGLPVVEWLGPVAQTANDIVLPAVSAHGEVLPEAIAYLQELLGHGPATYETVLRLGHAQGQTLRTLERAKAELNVVSTQKFEEGRNIWYWSLPVDHDSERIWRGLCREAPEKKPDDPV